MRRLAIRPRLALNGGVVPFEITRLPSLLARSALVLALLAPQAVAAASIAGVPASFAIEAHEPVLTLQAVGAQIYECKAKPDGARAWALREPIASLMQDGRTVGRHYAGPNWDVGEGGVTGKLMASAPGATPDDIPLLQLQVAGHHGAGPLADAQMVLRLHTVGGALAGACDREGDLRSVPYRADYVFLK